MKAIILAAGQGTRLRPLTDHIPKAMVEYRGLPILWHVVNALKLSGIDDICVVTGYCCDSITVEHQVQLIYNERYSCTNMVDSLLLAMTDCQEDILVSYSDIIYNSDLVRKLLRDDHLIAITADSNWEWLWEKRFEDPLSDAETFNYNSDNILTEIGNKPSSLDQIKGQYMGLFKIKKEALPIFKSYAENGFSSMTKLLSEIKDNIPISIVWTHGGWLEVDQLTDLDIVI